MKSIIWRKGFNGMEKSKMDENNEAKNKDEKKKGTQLILCLLT